MKIILEPKDFIEALTPFYNGCKFIAYVEKDDVKIGYGCYCLVNLLQGANKILSDRIRYSKEGERSRFSIKEFCQSEDDYQEARQSIITMIDSKCTHCDGTVLFKMDT